MDLLAFLQNSVTEKATLDEMVKSFEEMCLIPMEMDMVLFETGTYLVDGKEQFVLSLVRQFPNVEDDEFFQLHLRVCYEPTPVSAAFSECIWSIELEESIFDYVRRSPAFLYARNRAHQDVQIYMDET